MSWLPALCRGLLPLVAALAIGCAQTPPSPPVQPAGSAPTPAAETARAVPRPAAASPERAAVPPQPRPGAAEPAPGVDDAATPADTVPPSPSPLAGSELELERGHASWYGLRFHGRRTASGEAFDMRAMTAAHRTLPFGTLVRVRSLVNGREVLVRINDRGPHVAGRIIDLSHAAAQALGLVALGFKEVVLSAVDAGAEPGAAADGPAQTELIPGTGPSAKPKAARKRPKASPPRSRAAAQRSS